MTQRILDQRDQPRHQIVGPHRALEGAAVADERHPRETLEILAEEHELLSAARVIHQRRPDDRPGEGAFAAHDLLGLEFRLRVRGALRVSHRRRRHVHEVRHARVASGGHDVGRAVAIDARKDARVVRQDDGGEMKHGVHPRRDAVEARGPRDIAFHDFDAERLESRPRRISRQHQAPDATAAVEQLADETLAHHAAGAGHQHQRALCFRAARSHGGAPWRAKDQSIRVQSPTDSSRDANCQITTFLP